MLYLGISQSSLSHLLLVQNAAARLLTGTQRRKCVTPVLSSLINRSAKASNVMGTELDSLRVVHMATYVYKHGN